MHVKVSCKMTSMAMDMMLQLLNEAFKSTNFPKNHYEAKKNLRSLGLGYESIHAYEMIVHYFGKRTKICRCILFAKVVVGLKSGLHMRRRFRRKFSMHERDNDLLKDKRNYSLEVFRLVGRPVGKNE